MCPIKKESILCITDGVPGFILESFVLDHPQNGINHFNGRLSYQRFAFLPPQTLSVRRVAF